MSGYGSGFQGRLAQSPDIRGTITQDAASATTGFGAGFDSSNDSKAPTTQNINGRIITKLYIDLAGNDSATEDLFIIGDGTAASASIYKHSNSVNGYVMEIQMMCVEEPTTGQDNINLIGSTTDSAAGGAVGGDSFNLILAGEAWEIGASKQMSFGGGDLDALYLFLTCGDSGTAGAYGAGKFVITIIGNEAF